jgi:hypothetical protein
MPYTAAWFAVLPGMRLAGALIIVFSLKPSKTLIMTASHQRITAGKQLTVIMASLRPCL